MGEQFQEGYCSDREQEDTESECEERVVPVNLFSQRLSRGGSHCCGSSKHSQVPQCLGPSLSALASVATLFSVQNKLIDYDVMKTELKKEEGDANVTTEKISLLICKGKISNPQYLTRSRML